MCKFCLKHGAAGKWYNNSKNYLQETYDDAGASEYLEVAWGNLERAHFNKVYKLANFRGVSRNVKKPILGRLAKWYANRGFLKDGRKKRLKLNALQGHFGQVITLDEAKTIISQKAPVIVKGNCPCKFFKRGIKEATCLGFSPLQEVLPKLPRFIPENGLEVLDAEQAEAFLDEQSAKGRVNTVYTGPVPAIAAVCSCDVRSCGALDLRRFGITQCWKGHYVAIPNLDDCVQCENCADRCQFNALEYIKGIGPKIHPELCYGCGNCAEICEESAIRLADREEIPKAKGKW